MGSSKVRNQKITNILFSFVFGIILDLDKYVVLWQTFFSGESS